MRVVTYMAVGLLLAVITAGCGPETQSDSNALDERFEDLCLACDTHESCGDEDDYCLQNRRTGEAFCGVACESQEDCPGGYVCTEVGSTGINQCAPSEASCEGQREPCDGECTSDEVCVEQECVDPGGWEAEQQLCVDYLNDLRASVDEPPLERSAELETCATKAAIEDSRTGEPHGHFIRTAGCGYTAYAENEVPGWSLSMHGSVEDVIRVSADAMFAEGPGGGHYDNITGGYTRVGCGIYVTEADDVWVVHNFR